MSASHTYSSIVKMLEACAPGHSIRLATHSRVISWKTLSYPSFPKADKVEVGHIRKLARHFGILDCAKKHGVA